MRRALEVARLVSTIRGLLRQAGAEFLGIDEPITVVVEVPLAPTGHDVLRERARLRSAVTVSRGDGDQLTLREVLRARAGVGVAVVEQSRINAVRENNHVELEGLAHRLDVGREQIRVHLAVERITLRFDVVRQEVRVSLVADTGTEPHENERVTVLHVPDRIREVGEDGSAHGVFTAQGGDVALGEVRLLDEEALEPLAALFGFRNLVGPRVVLELGHAHDVDVRRGIWVRGRGFVLLRAGLAVGVLRAELVGGFAREGVEDQGEDENQDAGH